MIGDVNTKDSDKSKLRKEYEKTIELFNGFEILKNTYIKAAGEARENLEEFDSSQVYHVSVVEDDETKKTFELKEKEVVVIGRLPKCDFNSSNNRVSRVNCVITIFNGRVMVFDFYSLFGTWIKQKVTLEGDNQKKFNLFTNLILEKPQHLLLENQNLKITDILLLKFTFQIENV